MSSYLISILSIEDIIAHHINIKAEKLMTKEFIEKYNIFDSIYIQYIKIELLLEIFVYYIFHKLDYDIDQEII